MDEMTLLRELRADVAPADPNRLAALRDRLERRASPPPRRRRTPWLLAAAATAAVAVTAVVVAAPFSTPPASAAGLLHRAAERADADPAPGPGQYLAVETEEDALGYVQDDANRVIGAYRVVSRSITYVPHDRSGVWTRRSWSLPPTVFYGGEAVRAAAARDDAVSAHADEPNVERAVGGRFGNGELGGGEAGVGTDAIAAMPRDPRRLLTYLEDAPGVAPDSGAKVISEVSTLLRSGVVPRDLRSALFDALALLPDVRIVDHQTDLDGRTGTAIGVRDGDSVAAVVIDPDTGDYLGQRQTQLHREGAVPAGTVMDQTSLHLRVVDDAAATTR